MKIIKNSKELQTLLNEHKDLILPDEDVRIEYQVQGGELRNVKCQDLYLMNDSERFDFYGGNFYGGNFYGRNWYGGEFNGGDWNGRNFNGGYFNGKNVSYYAFFNCYGSIECDSIAGRRTPHAEPVSLENKITIRKKKDDATEEAMKLLKEKGYKIVKE